MGEAEKERVITEGDNGMEEEKDGEFHSHSHSQTQTQQQPNTSLAELNMLLVFLSLIYISTDECIEEGEGEEDKESTHIRREREQVPVAKACTLSRIQDKRNDPKLGRRSFPSRFQTTTRDFRNTNTMSPSVLDAIDHKMDEGDREVLYYGNEFRRSLLDTAVLLELSPVT
ncbi:hypothetical protein Ahy_A07g034961 [Arachis hypogaea]|uniref:Uncharacterized protein n=1 Tax=Arachis hypogaea TaxID=3818 RepID=A0A445CD60_ARAHY|nr:hypothetical protein Ahy_A07g034961 [Arachis hypogaea]